MNNTIRRQDRKISDSEAIAILQKGEFGILSMCTPDNEGYGIPLNFALQGNAIYFHCAIEGSKLEYLRNNNKVSFCVVGKTEVLPSKFGTIYESAIASGTASVVDGNEKYDALMHIIQKYSGNYIEEGKGYIQKFYDKVNVIKLSIESITAKARKQ
ncbi:MAG: pyridoxamine 5'-phosphate oxidase family protein [Bacteroidota bacterium]|nr:pyridoxamine 5'-phosphate oxidase family protein [Bacteroidota bacterium]